MDILTGTAIVLRLLDAASGIASKASEAGAIVGAVQKEGRPYTDEEKARLRALDDDAQRIEDAAIARAEAKAGTAG